MKNILTKIFNIFKDEKFHTAKEIGEKLKLSDKTIRNYIKLLNDEIKVYGGEIISLPRYGFILKYINKKEIILENEKNKIPISQDERLIYLIKKLSLNYIKLYDVSEEIFVSIKTLSTDIKIIEEKINKYDLKIIRRPYYGMKIEGSELNIRNLLIDVIETELNEDIFQDEKINYSMNKIANYSNKFFKENNIKISDISFQNFLVSVYITLSRIENKKIIGEISLLEEIFFEKKEIIKEYMKYLKETLKLNLKISKNDIDYIALHFLTNETITYKNLENKNILDIKELIDEIYFYINLTFKIDLTNEYNLYESLYTHLLALLIRIKFKIDIKNPLLDDIKINFVFEYNLAKYISRIIENKYNSFVSEAEIGYLAIIFSTSSKINTNNNKKKNILIVCPTGRGVSKYIVNLFKNNFSDYYNFINACGLNDLNEIDLSIFDVIFTLIDLKDNYNKPVYKINHFLEKEDIIEIKNLLLEKKYNLNDVFLGDLFTYYYEEVEKNEVIKDMCNKLKKVENIEENIENLIIEREKIGMTEISRYIAIPHPINPIETINKVGVVILKKPIKWNLNYVNIIFFLFLNKINSDNEYIYKIISKISDNIEIIEKIKGCVVYENFEKELNNLIERVK